jgi:multisubunit Na+/H+ antiporter MnhC subunit
MFRQLLNKIQGADIPMISSLLIFFIFFILVGIYLLIIDKNHIKHMSNLPFEGEKENSII